MDWLEITISVDPAHVELVADVLRSQTRRGVSIEQALEGRGEEKASLDRQFPVLVKAYAPVESGSPFNLEGVLSQVQPATAIFAVDTRVIHEEDWAESWKDHFYPERIGRIVVCPSWRRCRPRPDELLIRLDPGMAFGTGQHPTTRMCLLALQQRLSEGARVLDLGCGSGILAVAAAKLGVANVVAVDTDPVAVAVTKENVDTNVVADRVTVGEGSLGDGWPFASDWRGAFDCTVANISSASIIEMARPLVESLASKGLGIAAGISDERSKDCRRSLEDAGARIVNIMTHKDWRTLLFEVVDG